MRVYMGHHVEAWSQLLGKWMIAHVTYSQAEGEQWAGTMLNPEWQWRIRAIYFN